VASRVYAADRDTTAAERVLRKAITVDPASLQAYGLLGRLYLEQQRLGDARREFEALASRQPRLVAAHTMVGILSEIQQDRVAARAAYERALVVDARAAVPANNLAWMLAESGQDLDRALELAQTAKAGLPDTPAVDDTLGLAYYKKGLYSQAIAAFQSSTAQEPGNAAFQLRLGLAYMKGGRWQDSTKTLREALRLNPHVTGADEARKALEAMGQS